MKTIKDLMGDKPFTSKQFNTALNKTIEHGGWNSKVTLDFLYVAESLGQIKNIEARNPYVWQCL